MRFPPVVAGRPLLVLPPHDITARRRQAALVHADGRAQGVLKRLEVGG